MASGFGSASTSGFGSSSTSVPAAPLRQAPSETHATSLMRSLAGLFNNTKYSDATIRIHDVTLPVHKSIICVQSAHFENAFQDKFVEGTSGVLSFGEGSGAAHWRVFEYLYTGNCSEDLSTPDLEDDPTLLKDSRVHELADMFFIENLKVLSQTKFQKKLESHWMDDSFPECIQEVYTSTQNSDSKIRSAVVEIATAHTHKLQEKEIFRELLQDGGDFVVEYMDSLTKKISMR